METAEGYDALPPDTRGAVDYYRLGASGPAATTTLEALRP